MFPFIKFNQQLPWQRTYHHASVAFSTIATYANHNVGISLPSGPKRNPNAQLTFMMLVEAPSDMFSKHDQSDDGQEAIEKQLRHGSGPPNEIPPARYNGTNGPFGSLYEICVVVVVPEVGEWVSSRSQPHANNHVHVQKQYHALTAHMFAVDYYAKPIEHEVSLRVINVDEVISIALRERLPLVEPASSSQLQWLLECSSTRLQYFNRNCCQRVSWWLELFSL